MVHPKIDQARERATYLQSMGYTGETEPFSRDTLKHLGQSKPDAILVDLCSSPSTGRDIALSLRINSRTRPIPLVIVGGEPAKISRVRELLPDAEYGQWDTIDSDIKHAISNPPKNPVIPESAMAGYAGAPLPKKLGIDEGTRVYLHHAPEDHVAILGDLPSHASIFQDPTRDRDLTIWFCRSNDELDRELDIMFPAAENGGLWIAWPKKASGVQSDLSQAVVRKTGLDAGLVDFKVCSINPVWSGLRFTIRK